MKYILLLIFLFVTTCVSAQEVLTLTTQPPLPAAETQPLPSGVTFSNFAAFAPSDYASLQLPPLHVLMENARNTPQVNMYAASKEVEDRELKTIRRSWFRYIKFNATYSYGSNDMSSLLYYDTQYPPIQNVTGTVQSWWNVGANLSLPLDQIFNHRNQIKQQKKRIESIGFEVARYHDELCLKIIDAYTAASENLALLASAAQSLTVARAQYAVTETDFIKGRIDAQTLSRQRTVVNSVLREYEKTRSSLNNALLRLEVLSKTKIINQ